MGLIPGSRLGPYEILAAIGAGGMGEVYRATDTRLKRNVAIKVLPEAFSRDADRLARFQREAELLASLNHPNIAAIYGLESVGAMTGIVLELVEGETLADIVTRGPIALVDALPIARQMCEALETAHDKGVVHRDLKPANIKIAPDGRVKVLDFGLAKMLERDPKSSAMSMSPTLSVHATYSGVILGTAAYMSPEQARGKPVDRRTDVWAFGCVLYEMLTGTHAFSPGETVSDAIASVLTREPDLAALPADTPTPIRRLLRRCLKKDPQQRLPHIGTARLEIDEARSGSSDDRSAVTSPVAPSPVRAPAWLRTLPWAVTAAALASTAAVVALVGPWRERERARPGLVRVSGDPGAEVSMSASGALLALSPDGRTLAFQGATNARSQLYLRPLDQLNATALAGTEPGGNPFFSPDGQWIAFFTDGSLKKVSVSGGAVLTLCDAPGARGGTWAEDGTIFFANVTGGLSRVSSAGGKAEPATALVDSEVTHRFPQALPGGQALLYTSHTATGGFDQANIVVQSFTTGMRKVLYRGGYFGRYSSTGHLLFISGGTLFAVAFDLARLDVSGVPVPLVAGVTSNPTLGPAQFAVGANGTLVYRTASAATDAALTWLNADGTTSALRSALSDWSNVLFAPDGRRVAMDVADGGGSNVWVYEMAREALRRVTVESGDAERPVWTPDGTRIVGR